MISNLFWFLNFTTMQNTKKTAIKITKNLFYHIF